MTLDTRAVPSLGRVLGVQVHDVGRALRRPAAVGAVMLGVLTVALLTGVDEVAEGVSFHPERQMLPAVLGALWPLAVWRGVPRFGTHEFWALPVDRRSHALVRIAAGGIWLLAAVTLYTVWQLFLTLVTGGAMLPVESALLMPKAISPAGPLTPDDLTPLTIVAAPWHWIVPITAAIGTYALSSALALAARSPLRWIAVFVVMLFLLSGVGRLTRTLWLVEAPQRLASIVIDSQYGLDALLTARTESLKTEVVLTEGQRLVAWREPPRTRDWVIGSTLWLGLGALLLAAASQRHRERRP